MSDTLILSHPSLDDPRVFEVHQEQTGIDLEWFKQAQQSAWDQYMDLPYPVRTNEKWRFANIKNFTSTGNYRTAAQADEDAYHLVKQSYRLEKVAGRIILTDDILAAPVELNSELAAKGVIYTTLFDAIKRYPDLVKKYFMQQSPDLGSEKFEALHLALLRNGIFLYVPDNVEIQEPFMAYNWAVADQAALFPHTLFITGKNAKATLVEFQEAGHKETEHFIIANAHLYADDGSQPSHTIVQNWNSRTLSMQLNTNNAWNDTNAKSILINLGSSHARQEVHGKIFGSGSNVEMYSLNVPKGSQEIDQRTLQTHIAPNSRSDLLFKNALMDASRTIFSGLIIVEEDAQHTDAYQTNNNLMLSEDAEANSLPGLEIKANDVKCSHGATTGRVDESELFYFMARGIPPKKAQELMVFGYFEEIIGKLDNQHLAEYVRELVQHKFTD